MAFVLAQNYYFPLVISDRSPALHRAVLNEQKAFIQQHVAKKCQKGKRASKRAAKKRPTKPKACASLNGLFRPGLNNMPVPNFSGPCVREYLEEIGYAGNQPQFALAQAALTHGWPLWFGKRRVLQVGNFDVFQTHISCTRGANMSCLTPKSLPYLKAGEAMGRGSNATSAKSQKNSSSCGRSQECGPCNG